MVPNILTFTLMKSLFTSVGVGLVLASGLETWSDSGVPLEDDLS